MGCKLKTPQQAWFTCFCEGDGDKWFTSTRKQLHASEITLYLNTQLHTQKPSYQVICWLRNKPCHFKLSSSIHRFFETTGEQVSTLLAYFKMESIKNRASVFSPKSRRPQCFFGLCDNTYCLILGVFYSVFNKDRNQNNWFGKRSCTIHWLESWEIVFLTPNFSDFHLITITASLRLSEVGQSGSCRVVAMTAWTQGETLLLPLGTDHEQRDELSYRLCNLERLRETTVALKQICCMGFQLQQG